MSKNKIETRVPISWDLLFPGRFLKACDLQGRAVTITIKRLYQEKIDGKWKLIATFPEGKEKHELALNRTNGEALAAMFGRAKPQDWVGRRITIKEEMVQAFGKREPAIRIIGSPDIDQNVSVDVDLGRVSIRRTLRPTGRKPPPANGCGPSPTDNAGRQRPPAPELNIGPDAEGEPTTYPSELTEREVAEGWQWDELSGVGIPPEQT